MRRRSRDLLARVHAVRPRDRRGDGGGRGGARLEDERVRQLGRDRRRRCATSPTGSASRARRSKARSSRWTSSAQYATARRGGARATMPRRKHAPLVLRAPRGVPRLRAGARGRGRRRVPARAARRSARRVLADALARGEARHVAVKRNRAGDRGDARGVAPLGRQHAAARLRELARLRARSSATVSSLDEFRATPPAARRSTRSCRPAERERYAALPTHVEVRGKRGGDRLRRRGAAGRRPRVGVARLRLPEKLARTLIDEELPALDRPLRFVVHARPARRGARRHARRAAGAARPPLVAGRGGGDAPTARRGACRPARRAGREAGGGRVPSRARGRARWPAGPRWSTGARRPSRRARRQVQGRRPRRRGSRTPLVGRTRSAGFQSHAEPVAAAFRVSRGARRCCFSVSRGGRGERGAFRCCLSVSRGDAETRRKHHAVLRVLRVLRVRRSCRATGGSRCSPRQTQSPGNRRLSMIFA